MAASAATAPPDPPVLVLKRVSYHHSAFIVLKLDFLGVVSPWPLKRGDSAECGALIPLSRDWRGCWSGLLEWAVEGALWAVCGGVGADGGAPSASQCVCVCVIAQELHYNTDRPAAISSQLSPF